MPKLCLAFVLMCGVESSFAVLDWGTIRDADFSATIDQDLTVKKSDGSTQKFQTTIEPRWDIDLTNNTRLVGIGRIRVDNESKLGFSGSNEHVDLEVRELYVDTQWRSAYLRLGKQQIVWGQADGLRVLDVVNPLDLREFILPDFEDRRIPLWTANIEVPVNDVWTAQILWIPDQTYDELPERDNTYAMTSSLVVPQAPVDVPVRLMQAKKPQRKIMDSDAGVRFSAFLGGWDVSLNYFYHFQDQAILYRHYDGGAVSIEPKYERSHLIGGSFSNAFGDTTVRAEIGYSSDRYFLADHRDTDGIVRSGELSYVLGVDFQGWRDWFISAQIFQSYLTDTSDAAVRDRVDVTATVLLQRYFMNEALKAETLVIQHMADNDGLVQASLAYELTTDVQVNIGLDLFFGSSDGLYGQFKEEDSISFGVEFGF